MKKVIFTAICWAALTVTFAQDVNTYFQKGQEAIQENKLDKAIGYFDKAIELKKDEYVLWYNRAIVKSWQRRYEEAILDFDQAIQLNPEHKKSYNGRACSKQDITDYNGAMEDFNRAIQIDENYIDAIYNRGTLHNLLSNREGACADYNRAYSLGDEQAKNKVENCKETPSDNIHSILRLNRTAVDDTYGFSSKNPVKVGPGPDGGPANQRAYLNLLRDINGFPVDYKRVESCCGYKSENGLFGTALLDKYEIYYTNKKGKNDKAFVYISMYDYEEPQILFGFETVGAK